MKKRILTILTVILLVFSLTLIGCSNSSGNGKKAFASITSTRAQTAAMAVSVNSEPSRISFSSSQPGLRAKFGSKTYNYYNVCLSGLVSLSDIYLSSIPTAENGETITNAADIENISYYTDYFTFAFPITSDAQTIKIGVENASQTIDKNHLINGYYYLNLKWLKLSTDKSIAEVYNYANSNYILIEVKNSQNETLLEFILHITYDLTFI